MCHIIKKHESTFEDRIKEELEENCTGCDDSGKNDELVKVLENYDKFKEQIFSFQLSQCLERTSYEISELMKALRTVQTLKNTKISKINEI